MIPLAAAYPLIPPEGVRVRAGWAIPPEGVPTLPELSHGLELCSLFQRFMLFSLVKRGGWFLAHSTSGA